MNAEVQHTLSSNQTFVDLARFYYATPSVASALATYNQRTPSELLSAGTRIRLPQGLFLADRLSQEGPERSRLSLKRVGLRSDLAFVQVEEEVLRRNPRSAEIEKCRRPLAWRWIYVFSGHDLVMEVDAWIPDRWLVLQNKVLPEATAEIQDQTLLLKRGETYGLHVSSIRLDAQAASYLAQHHGECPTVLPFTATGTQTIGLVDPIVRGLTLHGIEYAPAVQEWQTFAQDRDGCARFFVASTLKALADDDDNFGVRNELQPGQPQTFLDEHQQRELPLRKRAEVSMAEIARWIDSHGLYALEQSALRAGDEGVSMLTAFYADVLDGVYLTTPGTALASRLVSREEGLFLRQVFTENRSVLPDFSTNRYEALATLALMGRLGPAMTARHLAQGEAKILERFQKYIDSLGTKTSLEAGKKVRRNKAKGRPLAFGLREQYQPFRKLVAEPAVREAAAIPKWVAKSTHLSEVLRHSFATPVRTFAFALEIINLSASAAASAKPDSTRLDTLSVVGASADFLLCVGDTVGVLSRSVAGKLVGGVLGIISGAMDAIAFGASTKKDIGLGDYGASVGHTIAAGGAVLLLVAGAIQGTSAFAAGAAFLGAGLVASIGMVFVFGAVLVALGVTIAYLLKGNPYEIFARFSFLGKESWQDSLAREPLPLNLPSKKAQDEAAVLRWLLGAFRVVSTDGGFDVVPGFYLDGDILELEIEQHHLGTFPKNVCGVAIDLGEATVTQTSGRDLRPAILQVANGRIDRVRMSSWEVQEESGPILQLDKRVLRARLRLASSGMSVPSPPSDSTKESWVEIALEPGSLAHERPSSASSWDENARLIRARNRA